MATEPITGETYQEAGSLQTDALQNSMLNYFGAWVNCAVLTIGDAAPPGSPANGDCYIVGTGTGAWAGHDDELAVYRDGWQFYEAKEGRSQCLNLGDGFRYAFTSGAWAPIAAAVGSAAGVEYDNTASGMTADNLQEAIDELHAAIGSAGGASIGVQFVADTASTSDADPGAGNLRWNHATQTSATVIYVDDATFDGASLTAIWPRLNAGGVLFLQHATNQDIWQIWEFTAINDASGYAKLTVTLWAAAGTFADNDPILVTLDKGQGSGAVTSVNGAGGTPIIRQALAIACSDETTALTAGTNKVKFINPYSTAFNVLEVVASLSTAQATNGAGGILTIDINEAGSSILSTKLTIDNTETNSSTAATPAVVSDALIAAYAEIGIDIDQVGDGTAKGLKVYLIGYPTP